MRDPFALLMMNVAMRRFYSTLDKTMVDFFERPTQPTLGTVALADIQDSFVSP